MSNVEKLLHIPKIDNDEFKLISNEKQSSLAGPAQDLNKYLQQFSVKTATFLKSYMNSLSQFERNLGQNSQCEP